MGGGSSKTTNKVTAAGQEQEAILPSATSPGVVRGGVSDISSADGGSAAQAFESAPGGATEGQGSAHLSSKGDLDPARSENAKGGETKEGTNEDAEALARLFPGEGDTPPEEVMLWVNDEGDYDEKLDAEKEHQRALTWLKGVLPLAHKHSKVKDWIKRLLAV